MKATMNRIAAILLTLCLGLTVSLSHAGDNVDIQRLQAAQRFISTLGISDLFVEGAKRGFSDSAKQNPARAKEMAWVLEQVTAAEATQRMAPIYAEFLTASQTNELRIFFSTPPGDKFWRAISTTALAGKPFALPPLSPQENIKIQAFTNNSLAWRTLGQSQSTIQTKLKDATNSWMRELAQRHVAEFNRQMADALTANTDATTEPGSSGAPLPEVIALLRDYNIRNRRSLNEFQARVGQIDLATVLTPPNLTSREGIAQGRSKVDRYETEFNRRWREYNAASDELVQAMKNISETPEMRNGFMVGAEKGLANTYERSMRFEENQRTLITLMRQLLTLADERFGKIKNEDNRLIFDDSTDLSTYESLRQRLEKEAKVETQLAQEEQQIQDASLRKLRGEPAAQTGKVQ